MGRRRNPALPCIETMLAGRVFHHFYVRPVDLVDEWTLSVAREAALQSEHASPRRPSRVPSNLNPAAALIRRRGRRSYVPEVSMPATRSKPSRSRYCPAPRTADSVADLSRLNASNPIGRCNKRYVLRRIIAMNNDRHALREKKVSYKTMYERDHELQLFFNTLWSLPQWVAVDPRSLRPKHMIAVFDEWHAQGLSAKTLTNRLSSLRTFAFWIGKRGLVEAASNLGLDVKGLRTSQVATRDKSWSAMGVDVKWVIAEAEKWCPFVAASIELEWVFGLRRRESVMSFPHEGVVPIDEARFYTGNREGISHVFNVVGAKGKRPRQLPIETDEQWAAIHRAQALVAPGQPLGRPGKLLEANLSWMDHVLAKIGITKKKLGVTGHGLRHQKFNDDHERITGEPSPVRGGKPVDPEVDKAARDYIAEIAGHGRRQIVSAYCGSRRGRTADTANEASRSEQSATGVESQVESEEKT
jgi:integrase